MSFVSHTINQQEKPAKQQTKQARNEQQQTPIQTVQALPIVKNRQTIVEDPKTHQSTSNFIPYQDFHGFSIKVKHKS